MVGEKAKTIVKNLLIGSLGAPVGYGLMTFSEGEPLMIVAILIASTSLFCAAYLMAQKETQVTIEDLEAKSERNKNE